MNALSLFATLGLDTKDYDTGLDRARGNAENFGSQLTSILKKIAVAAALKQVADGIISITKQAVSAFSQYEQLVGGVETLFGARGDSLEKFAERASKSMYKLGQSGDDVLALQKELIDGGYLDEAGADGIYGPKTQAAFDAYARAGGQMVEDQYNQLKDVESQILSNAENAYKTAGMDANTYMETVTGFSASLIQSLGGDTSRAAELSDLAITDMSDNANKMGTNIESIRYAYMGFAKQNYTMLDNLKLGGHCFSRAA